MRTNFDKKKIKFFQQLKWQAVDAFFNRIFFLTMKGKCFYRIKLNIFIRIPFLGPTSNNK